jgi:hypothetical protein
VHPAAQSCLLSSPWVKSSTKTVLEFFGGSMNLTGFFDERDEALCDIETNGRRGRE